jgi:predicted DNA-binding transcriptional regulator AlpA
MILLGDVAAPSRGSISRRSFMATLDDLPVELARHRVLSTPDTCKFLGISVAQWRELRRLGETPPPIMLGTKKQGWRILDLIHWIESRGEQAA